MLTASYISPVTAHHGYRHSARNAISDYPNTISKLPKPTASHINAIMTISFISVLGNTNQLPIVRLNRSPTKFGV